MGETRTGILHLGLLWGALGLTLTGCATTPVPTPSATITSAPTPTLADAVDAFARFNTVLDGYTSGSRTVSEFEPLVTPDYLKVLEAEDASRDTSTWTVGATSFSEEKLVDPTDWGGYGDLSLVVCRDISRTKVVEMDGSPSSAKPIRSRIPMIVYFASPSGSDGDLLIVKVDQWNEDGYCS